MLKFLNFSQSSPSHVTIDNSSNNTQDIHFNYTIFNNGPSKIRKAVVAIQIPAIYTPNSKTRIPLVKIIDAQAFYHLKLFNPTWHQNDKESIRQSSPEEMKDLGFDFSKNGLDFTFNSGNQNEHYLDDFNQRKKRNVAIEKEDYLRNLPVDRTMIADCASKFDCIEAQFVIDNFEHSEEPISIYLRFSIDLKKLGECGVKSYRTSM